MITIGTKCTAELTVTDEKTAMAVGSGELQVLATPVMTALMEEAAYKSIKGFLKDGESSVGISLDIKHIAATPVGRRVRAESVVTAADERRVTFRVSAYDETGLIGEGTHCRAVIATERFLKKCSER